MRFWSEDGAAGAHTALTTVFGACLTVHAPALQAAAVLTVVMER